MTVAESFGRLGMVGLHEDRVALGQVHHEEPDLLLDAAKHGGRLPEVGLRVPWRVGQRHEHFLGHLPARAHVVPHRRVAAVEPALVAEPLEDPPGGVALLGSHLLIVVQDLLDEARVIRKLGAAHRHLPPVPGRRRARDHLRNGAPVDPETQRRSTVA